MKLFATTTVVLVASASFGLAATLPLHAAKPETAIASAIGMAEAGPILTTDLVAPLMLLSGDGGQDGQLWLVDGDDDDGALRWLLRMPKASRDGSDDEDDDDDYDDDDQDDDDQDDGDDDGDDGDDD